MANCSVHSLRGVPGYFQPAEAVRRDQELARVAIKSPAAAAAGAAGAAAAAAATAEVGRRQSLP